MLDSAWTILSETCRFAQVQLEKLDDDNWDRDDEDEKDQDGAESHSQHYDFAASKKIFIGSVVVAEKKQRINDTNTIPNSSNQSTFIWNSVVIVGYLVMIIMMDYSTECHIMLFH